VSDFEGKPMSAGELVEWMARRDARDGTPPAEADREPQRPGGIVEVLANLARRLPDLDFSHLDYFDD